jgi:hypothetical protein
VPATSARGTIADVERQIEGLLNASDPHAFLVIELQGTTHFLQFTASADAIEMDYPLVSDEQRQREDLLRTLCTAAGLRFRQTEGSDGTKFLDCDLPHDAARAAAIVRRALEELFGATSTTQLLFSGAGLPKVAA